MDRAEKIARLADACIAAYRQDTSTCLCAVLGAVTAQRSNPAVRNAQTSYRQGPGWGEQALGGENGLLAALLVIFLL
jgi:TetR/AcrR family transcriptional repressor of nem operon